MTCLKRTAAGACRLALLLLVSGVWAGALAAAPAGRMRFDGVEAADASQRRRQRRRVKRRMAERAEEGRIAQGLWGGSHLRLSVQGDGAYLEFDCARGQISAPFVTDAEGLFDLPGTYTREGPGPIRIGREPSARPARYSGSVRGSQMTLIVRLADSDKPLGDYTLTRGDEGRVVKCR